MWPRLKESQLLTFTGHSSDLNLGAAAYVCYCLACNTGACANFSICNCIRDQWLHLLALAVTLYVPYAYLMMQVMT